MHLAGFKLNFLRPVKGVAVPGYKEKTARQPIIEGPAPNELIFPMKMHTGAPAEVRVEEGELVKIGTLLGEAPQHVSANIHSSVSGRVKGIDKRESFRGSSLSVVIENNGLDEEDWLESLDESISLEKFFTRLTQSGIIGKGGAGFPTHVKFAPPGQGHRYMLINGAECEPFSTTDHRIMLEYTDEVLRAIDFMRQLFGTEYNVVAIEDDKPDAIECFKRAVSEHSYRHIKIKKVSGRYPQGDQGVLLKAVFDLEIPSGTFPSEMGVITSNVSTIKAIYDAVFLGQPLVKRVITVTGPAIVKPQNILSRIGTPVRDIINFCGGFTARAGKIINGGPMMGMPFSDLSIPVVKDTTTILCLGEDAKATPGETACIRCAKCVDVCPVNLQPILISNAYRSGRFDLCEILKAGSCIRCGCCTYICPSKIPLLEDIKAGMDKLREMQNQAEGKQ